MALRPKGYIEDLPAYPLGKDYSDEDIRLSGNENPLGPPAKALERIKSVLYRVHRYPDGLRAELTEKLACWLGVAPENLVLGNGSNEIIDLVAKVFLGEGEEVLVPEPGYAYYRIAARSRGAKVKGIPLKGFRVDLDSFAAQLGPKTRVVFLDNPNNPTGTVFGRSKLRTFMEEIPQGCVVVIDCAYAEFVQDPEYPSLREMLEAGWPIVVLRTFSKFFGLAGLRVGYGVAMREIADVLNRVRQPFNISTLSLAGAIGALEDEDHQRRTLEVIHEGREILRRGWERMGLFFVPSEANFFLVRVGPRKSELLSLLKEHRIVVRDMAGYGLPEYIRVSVGLPEENRRLLELMELWRKGSSSP